MIDPTLSSTLQSLLDEEKSLSKESPLPVQKAFELSDIPHFTTTNQELPSFGEPSSCTTQPSNPTSEETTEYEYEFSCLYNGHLSFVGIFDSNDISACERLLHRPVDPSEITYSSTGNGFVKDEEFKFTFTKRPFERSVVEEEPRTSVRLSRFQEAADILANL